MLEIINIQHWYTLCILLLFLWIIALYIGESIPSHLKIKSRVTLFYLFFKKIHVSKQMNIIGWKMKVLFQFFSKPSFYYLVLLKAWRSVSQDFIIIIKNSLCLIMMLALWQFSEKPSSCIDRVNFQFSSNWVDIGVRLELKVENSMLEGQCLITPP